MSKTTDWLPASRAAQLSMAKDWQGVMGANAAAWGIPPIVLTGLGGGVQASDSALAVAENEATRTPVATAQVMVETFLVGRHELGVRIIYVTGNPHDPANRGCRIWHGVAAPGETPPAGPEDLRESFFIKRKKDVIEFEFGASGSICRLAVQVENAGRKRHWGSLVSALIP